MEVKSKFNKGDTIYFMGGEIPMKGKISGITFFTGKSISINGTQKSAVDKPAIIYHIENSFIEVKEDSAYPSKEDLIKGVFDELDKPCDYSPFDGPVKA